MPADVASGIPRRLHQTWRTATPDRRLRGFQAGWRRHHPGWEYRLWTDEDLRAFVAEAAPDMLAIFDAYAQPIARVDMARYLILQKVGGLFVDLDMQCLRPVDPLLAGQSLVIGTEPAAHDRLAKAALRGVSGILCPSFLASVPGHPFWNELRRGLQGARDEPDVLDATGPFLLSRVHAGYRGPAPVSLVPAPLLYPADKMTCWSGALFDIEEWERVTRPAYALHHWDGSWFRKAPDVGTELPRRAAVHVTDWPLSSPEDAVGPRRSLILARAPATESPALVSCLMVTKGRPSLAALAIDSYRRQTWERRELVIVDDDPDETLARHVAALGDPTIRHLRLPPENRSLGALRNIAVAAASGAFVCQWDDDDLYDPARIGIQMQVLAATGARACFLRRWLQWEPRSGRIFVSARRVWEGSILCEKAVLPPYPDLPRGEDTPAVLAVCATARVVHLDMPRLYLYVAHGGNTHARAHHAFLLSEASAAFDGPRARAVADELSRRLPLASFRRALEAGDAARGPERPRTLDDIRREAREATRNRRPSAAQILWEEVLAAAPGDPEAMLGLARALVTRGRIPQARLVLARHRETFPDAPDGLLALARLEAASGDDLAALAHCDALLARHPDHVAALFEQALALLRLDRADAAEGVLARVEAVAPGRQETFAGLATIATHRQDWPLAVRRWAELWKRFAYAVAPVEIVTALVHLDELDDAEAFVRRVAADRPALGLAMLARLCRLTHDWPRMLCALEARPDVADTSPELARLRVEALNLADRCAEALLHLDRRPLGRQAVAQAAMLTTLLRAAPPERLRAWLLDLATPPNIPTLSVQVLPDLLECVCGEEGERGVHVVLDLIEASPAMRTVKLAAVFERDLARARTALADPAAAMPRPAGGRTARLLAALDTPCGPTSRRNDRMVRRAIALTDAIARRHPGAPLDPMTDPHDAFTVAERIALAIRRGEPLSVVRLGDGEGNFLPYAAGRDRHRRADQLSIQRIWWPEPLREAADIAAIERLLAAAIRSADIVGVPDLYRLIRNFADGIPPNQTSRGALAVAEQFAGAVPPPEGVMLARPGMLVTSCHLHNALAYWRLWEPLLAAAGRCSLVCGRADLAAALADRFGVAIGRVHLVPPERKFAAGLAEGAPPHFARMREIRDGLGATAPGEVVLVAAGILGKIYCADVRAAGGIAIDVGSLADYWCGTATRSAHETAAFRSPVRFAAAYAARPGLDADYPALRPAAFYAAAGVSGTTVGG